MAEEQLQEAVADYLNNRKIFNSDILVKPDDVTVGVDEDDSDLVDVTVDVEVSKKLKS